MEKQKIIWTVLPNGYSPDDPTKLRLSVFVSPRLATTSGSPLLGLFDDFLDWPAALNEMSFAVQFSAGVAVAATRVGEPIESPLWKAMFKSTGKVDTFTFQPVTNKIVRSYPYANVHDWVKTQYQQIILDSPEQHPTSQSVAAKLEPLMFYESPSESKSVPDQLLSPSQFSTRSMVNRDRTLKGVNYEMQEPVFSGGMKSASIKRPGQPSTRLQGAKVHSQLNTLLNDAPNLLYATIALDLQHLTQDPTLVFKASTVNALDSIYKELEQKKAIDTAVAAEPTRDFLQVTFFHRPKQPNIIAIPAPTYDFHQAVASLTNYPEIMKRVGLVFELEVPASALNGDTMRLFPLPAGGSPLSPTLWSGSVPTEHVRPYTKFEHNGGTKLFRAKPKVGSEISNGLLNVGTPKYRLTNLDVDGSAMKLMALANTLIHFTPPDMRPQRMAAIDPVATAAQIMPSEFSSKAVVVEEASLPALRTSGINLIKTNQALAVIAKFNAATMMNTEAETPSPNLLLYLDDIVAGYRVDVRDSVTETWRSLCKRKGTYRFTAINETRNYDDEGFVELGVSSAVDGSLEDLQNTLYMPEVLTSWDGWSKAAPPPGLTIIQGDNPNVHNRVADDTWHTRENESKTDYGLSAHFKVQPGTLPRLRYGVGYRLRLRVVDLAGNSLSLEQAPQDTTGATSQLTYTRFEPVPTPFLVPRTGIKSGESVEHIVVRSNFNKTAAEYAALFPIPDYPGYPAERHVVPSRQTQRMAEEYGRFDDPGSGQLRKSDYGLITSNDAFFTPVGPQANGMIGAAEGAKQAVHTELAIGVPWLPDIGRGATFKSLPGMAPGGIRKMDFGPFSAWPDLKPFIVRLIEGTGAPEETTEGGVKILIVKLDKAEFDTATYSSNIAMEDLQRMGVWEWLEEAGSPDQTKALDGLNWSITPARGLTFIHVLQQPLKEPKVLTMTANKELGETFALLSGKIEVHGKSSSKHDLYAYWDEPIDNLALPGPKTIVKKNLAFQDQISYDDTEIAFTKETAHITGAQAIDKVKGKEAIGIMGRAKSLTTYRVQNSPVLASKIMRPVKNYSTLQHGAVTVGPNGEQQYAVPPESVTIDGRRRHDFGDTKYRRVNYRPVATSRFREYFLDVIPKITPKYEDLDDQRTDEQDSTKRLLTRTGTPAALDILNSARPDAPKVLYVIPSFGWEKEESGTEITSKRVSGLRIWMERPWYSSGEGEQLGIVVWPTQGKKTKDSGDTTYKSGVQGMMKTDIKSGVSGGVMGGGMQVAGALGANIEIPDKLLPYVTQWGADPIWMAGKLTSLPKVGDFLNPAGTDTGLSMAEFPGKGNDEYVSVAAYDVGYDKDRRLWYCDIEVDPHEAYFPFIRLAMARYQKNSVVDAHLSRIVMADFIQVAPDRSATLTFDAANPRKLRVAVTGLAYRATAAGQFPSEVEVTVEVAEGPSGDLEWIPVENSSADGLDRIGGLGRKLWDGLWAGELKLPYDRGSRPMRLVVREFEVLLGDSDTPPGGIASSIAAPSSTKPGYSPNTELRRRLVYADVIEI